MLSRAKNVSACRQITFTIGVGLYDMIVRTVINARECGDL